MSIEDTVQSDAISNTSQEGTTMRGPVMSRRRFGPALAGFLGIAYNLVNGVEVTAENLDQQLIPEIPPTAFGNTHRIAEAQQQTMALWRSSRNVLPENGEGNPVDFTLANFLKIFRENGDELSVGSDVDGVSQWGRKIRKVRIDNDNGIDRFATALVGSPDSWLDLPFEHDGFDFSILAEEVVVTLPNGDKETMEIIDLDSLVLSQGNRAEMTHVLKTMMQMANRVEFNSVVPLDIRTDGYPFIQDLPEDYDISRSFLENGLTVRGEFAMSYPDGMSVNGIRYGINDGDVRLRIVGPNMQRIQSMHLSRTVMIEERYGTAELIAADMAQSMNHAAWVRIFNREETSSLEGLLVKVNNRFKLIPESEFIKKQTEVESEG